MSRDRRGDPEPTIERIAHAFSPAEWSGRWLAAGIVVFAGVAVITVIQRALLADSAVGWMFTAVHALIVVVVVPVLSMRTVRQWRARRDGAVSPRSACRGKEPDRPDRE